MEIGSNFFVLHVFLHAFMSLLFLEKLIFSLYKFIFRSRMKMFAFIYKGPAQWWDIIFTGYYGIRENGPQNVRQGLETKLELAKVGAIFIFRRRVL